MDAAGNVLIKKPASPGKENRPVVVLQSHLDMVHQKNADTQFDFDRQGIQMYVDGDWVKAQGTTLGADNGIGVATIMAILASKDIPHPPLEALFTIDEETGMTGALALKAGQLSGKYLLNLDTEDDCELTIGCAGGVGENCRRIDKREDFKKDKGRDVEEWIATPQAAADQTKILATHDSTLLLTDFSFRRFGLRSPERRFAGNVPSHTKLKFIVGSLTRLCQEKAFVIALSVFGKLK